MAISIRPMYDFRRPSRRQLWGIYVNGACILVTRIYPGWAFA